VQVREVYERAVANVPPANEKRYWQRYIYLWIKYALFEELEAQDKQRTREVYRACLKLIPHRTFTFAKVPLLSPGPLRFSMAGSSLSHPKHAFAFRLASAANTEYAPPPLPPSNRPTHVLRRSGCWRLQPEHTSHIYTLWNSEVEVQGTDGGVGGEGDATRAPNCSRGSAGPIAELHMQIVAVC